MSLHVEYSLTWHDLPSPLYGPARHVTAVARGRDRIDLFGVGVNEAVWTTWWTRAGGWAADWTAVVPSGRFGVTQQIAAVSRDGVGLDLFVVADEVHTLRSGDDGEWSPEWTVPVPGSSIDAATGFVTAVSPAPDRIELFGIGVDAAVRTAVWTAHSGWDPEWSTLRPSGRFPAGQAVTAVSRRPDGVELFVLDGDGAVATLGRTPGQDWDQEWLTLPPGAGFDVASQRVAVAAPGSGHLLLFAVGENDAVWCENSDAELAWNSEWSTLDGGGAVDHTTQTAAASSPAPGRSSVFAIGSDGTLRRLDGSDVGFDGASWTPVPGAPVVDPATARVVTAGSDAVFVVGVDDDQAVTIRAATDGG